MTRRFQILHSALLAMLFASSAKAECPPEKLDLSQSKDSDVQLIVNLPKDQFALTANIPISVTVTNRGTQPVRVVHSNAVRDDYCLKVYSADGKEVPGFHVSREEKGVSGFSLKRLQPGQAFVESLDLKEWAQITTSGTYKVSVARTLTSWDADFVHADKFKIVITPRP